MSHNPKVFRRGVTLVELLVALAVVAVLSTAIATMLVGAGKTHQYVNYETDTMSNVENAYRRILHNVRTASSLVNPTTTTVFTPSSGSPLQILTQVDPNNGNVSATVKYYKDSNNNLVESDSRYTSGGSPIISTLVYNVSSFSVQKINSSGTPTQISITITVNTDVNGNADSTVTRSAIITCRNL